MRINGLALLVNNAVKVVPAPALRRYREAIVLGSLREDVSYLPGLGAVVGDCSLSQFYKRRLPGGFVRFLWPGARSKGAYFFRKAVREYRAGRRGAGFVQLGRVAHLLSDMACPVHVHRRVHDTDLFEWYIESHCEELGALPVPPIPEVGSPAQLIASLARFTARFTADATQWPVGRALKKRGIMRAIPKAEVAQHARAIIPVATAHMAGLFRLYLDRVDDW